MEEGAGARGEHPAASHHDTFHKTAAIVSVLVLEFPSPVEHKATCYNHNLLRRGQES